MSKAEVTATCHSVTGIEGCLWAMKTRQDGFRSFLGRVEISLVAPSLSGFVYS